MTKKYSLEEAIEEIRKIKDKHDEDEEGCLCPLYILQILLQVRNINLSKEDIKLILSFIQRDEYLIQNEYCEEDNNMYLLKSKLEKYLEEKKKKWK